MSKALDAAWASFRSCVERGRTRLLAEPWASERPAQTEYLLYQVEAAAFNMAIAPNTRYPTFFKHTIFEPLVYTHSHACADFNYRFCFLDGARSYRVHGRRNTSLFLDFQVMDRLIGLENPKRLGNYELETFVKADGSFDIVVSADHHEGDWINISRESRTNMMLVREFFYDWNAEQGAELHIEPLDDVRDRRMMPDEAELVERLSNAEKLFGFGIDDWAISPARVTLDAVGENKFYDRIFAKNAGAANNPSAIYPGAMFRIAADEALIIETEIPNTRYWNVQVGDALWQVSDFTFHQSSINGHQAALDADGKFRAVISLTDPGVPNWLDPVGNLYGSILFRFYSMDRPVVPTATLVSLARLRDYLPRETGSVSAEERTRRLRMRRDGARRRFDY